MFRRNISSSSTITLTNNDSLESPSITFNKPLTTTNNMVNISSRDRTSEFHSTIRAFQTRVAPKPQPLTNSLTRQRHIEQYNQFMHNAKKIGKALTNTCLKLEKLTTLAKKRSLFDDKPAEIQELTYIIKNDISNLNKEIGLLQQLVNSHQAQNTKNIQKHSSNVVISLQSKLANVSKEFQHVLEVRGENLKQQSLRKEQFVKPGNAGAMSLTTPKLSGYGKSLLMDEMASGGETVLNMESADKRQYQQRLMLMEETDTYVRDRANAMESIEQTIGELGTIFQQLGTMIKEQDELIQRIDHNVKDAEMNVTAAHSELLKYFQSITSNRWLIIKIFFVLIVFFVIFIVFMA